MAKLTIRIWILIIALFLALLMISPSLKSGIVIKGVDKGSSAFEAGLAPGMVIKQINSVEVSSIEDYGKVAQGLLANSEEKRISITTDKDSFIFLDSNLSSISVGKVPKSHIKTGLDLSGGARALVRPVNGSLTEDQMKDLVEITNQRLNVFGLTDLTVRSSKDLAGNNFMLVEVAGASTQDLEELVGKQGNFEAKIGDIVVFVGGDKDITHVFRDASQSAVYQPEPLGDGTYSSRFQFTITLSPEAAQRHADITNSIPVDSMSGGQYLSQNLTLLLDGEIVDELRISSGLRGQVTTQISIQGSGTGTSPELAANAARAQMHKLQTLLLTGSIPYQLEIVKLDTISPSLGESFTRNIIVLGLSVFLIVSVVLFIRYRKVKLTLAVILTMFSEAFITLGIAALLRWNLDAASIAGIIAGMGTGVNDQIVIIDESKSKDTSSIKEKVKKALFIVFGAFFTIIAAMIPLFWAGAGLLRGFAFTTIIGITVGILITRPAFADIIRKMGDQ
jgi:preprotein translocase subunit SecD